MTVAGNKVPREAVERRVAALRENSARNRSTAAEVFLRIAKEHPDATREQLIAATLTTLNSRDILGRLIYAANGRKGDFREAWLIEVLRKDSRTSDKVRVYGPRADIGTKRKNGHDTEQLARIEAKLDQLLELWTPKVEASQQIVEEEIVQIPFDQTITE